MKVALGRLGWAPAVFWASTPQELWAGYDQWIDDNCKRKDDEPLDDDDVFTLKDMMRRFPDEPAGKGPKKKGVTLTPEMAKGLFGD